VSAEERSSNEHPPGRFASLAPRAGVAVVLVPILIWAGIRASWEIWLIVNLSFAIAIGEWRGLARARGRRIPLPLFAAAVLLAVNTGFCPDPAAPLFALTLALMLLAIERTLRPPVEGMAADLGTTLTGLLYLGLLGSFIPKLLLITVPGHPSPSYMSIGSASFFILFITTWATDTAAYFSGLLLGRHALFPAVSPKKTVEGLVGGVLGAALAGWIASQSFAPFLRPWDGIGLGAALALIGQLGDLVESSLKRDAGVKDASSILPGHGGMLDRLDSLLFTAPCAYLYLRIVLG